MKPRIRPLSNLFHRWGRHLGVDAEFVARALETRGIIERIGPDQYRERELRRIPKADFDRQVIEAIMKYRGYRHGQP